MSEKLWRKGYKLILLYVVICFFCKGLTYQL